MQFGIWTPARVDIWPAVKRGEELGFTHAFIYDSQMIYPDTFACLALCAEHTTKIKLGQGVTNPASRIAPLMASCLGTINQMAPGRAFLGIGTGFSTRRAMGLPAARVDDLAEYVRVVRALTRGEIVEYTEGKRTQLIQMIHREGSIDPTFMNFRDPIPIYVEAGGPRMRAVAGELADGVIGGGRTEEQIAQLRKDMQVGADKVGRRAEDLEIHSMTRIYIIEKGEKMGSERMRRTMAPIASFIGAYAAGYQPSVREGFGRRINDEEIPSHLLPLVRAYRQLKADVKGPSALDGPAWYATTFEGHGWKLHDELLPLVTEEVMRSQGLIGTADEILRQIKEWESLGITSVGPMCWDSVENVNEMVERFGREIIQRY